MPRLIRRYRRPLAFLLAFLGVLVALSSMRERPDTWQATVVATDLAGGHVLTAADLRTAAASAGTRPTTAVGHPDDAIGRVLAGPVAAGEILSEHRLIGPSLLDGSPPGHVAIPITLDDAAEATFLRTGDVVDVMAARRSSGFETSESAAATIVARAVRVLALPGTDPGQLPGLLGGARAGSTQATVVVVGLPPASAAAVAGAAATSRLSLLVREDPAPSAPSGGPTVRS